MNNTKLPFQRDESDRYVLNTIDEIISYIEYGFEKQSIDNGLEREAYIDLSNCNINLNNERDSFSFYLLLDKVDYVQRVKYNPIVDTVYNQIVKKDLIFNGSIIYNLWLSSTIFEGRVSFSQSFIYGGDLGNSIWHKDVYFSNCEFEDCSSFSFSKFNKSLRVQRSIFNSLQIDFHDSIFNGSCELSEITIKEKLSTHGYMRFTNTQFNSNFSVIKTSIPYNTLLKNIKVRGEFTMKDINSSHQLNLNNSVFKGNFMLEDINFSDVLCSNIQLYSISRIFISKKNDQKTNSLHLNNCFIGKDLGIQNYNLNKLSFSIASFGIDSVIRIWNNSIKEINFTGSCNRGVICFLSNNIENITFSHSVNKGSVEFDDNGLGKLSKTIQDPMTARILKDSAIKSNNQTNALHLRAIEFKMLEKEDITTSDRAILLLHKISNNYDQSFIRGVVFTCVIGLLFLIPITLIESNYTIASNYHEFFSFLLDKDLWKQYINILNVFSTPLTKNFSVSGEIFFLISRIFISYGIYQTIYAFYKYMRKV